MTQEDKELLLKDLCARLPYGVIVNAQYKDGEGWKTEDRKFLGIYEGGQVYLDCVYTTIDCIKPYLRSLSSMTEEEKHKLLKFGAITCLKNREVIDVSCVGFERHSDVQDYLNTCHFDYRGLIPKGLAIEVTEENNPYKTELS